MTNKHIYNAVTNIFNNTYYVGNTVPLSVLFTYISLLEKRNLPKLKT
jgi:hypothetical protein